MNIKHILVVSKQYWAYNIVLNNIVITQFKCIRKNVRHQENTVYPKKYAHGFCFAVLCCVYTLTDFPISIRLTSLALWQSNECPSASKATLMNIDKYFMWIHYERLHNHNKAKHNKTVCIFLGMYCMSSLLVTNFRFTPPRSYIWYACHSNYCIITFNLLSIALKISLPPEPLKLSLPPEPVLRDMGQQIYGPNSSND